MDNKNAQFAGSIPATYDRYLGPVFFEPYAEDLVERLSGNAPSSVLELACGTGIVTRLLRERLSSGASLVATDLNQAMIDIARSKFAGNEAIEWRQADACDLPFDDQAFDAVVCQFGIMFVPDKPLCGREVRRVLKPGGIFLFSVWDSLEENPLGQIAHETIASFFENDPPAFYQVPFGYHDRAEIQAMLEAAGFRDVRLDPVSKTSVATRVEDAATGLVQGSPILVAITERDPAQLPIITSAVADALRKHFGDATFRAPMRAIVVEARA
jgi:ubiquinone/menaquinone biosynthesis C-methylase UbiE